MVTSKQFLNLIWIVPFFVFLTGDTVAQSFDFSGKRKQHTLSFKLIKNLIVIPVMINNKGPYNFLLDTGIGLCLITDPTLVDTLQIKGLRNIKITGFGQGEELTASIAPKISMQIGKAKADSLSVIILKEDLLRISETLGMQIHGLIGYDFFNSFIVEIKYSSKRLVIYKPHTGYKPKKNHMVPLSIEDKKPYLNVLVELTDNEILPLKLIIDTGAGHAISLEELQGGSFAVPENNIEANLGIGLLGPIKGHIARIKRLKIGDFTLHNVVASFPEFREVQKRASFPERNGNLGNPVLKKFNVTFDYSRSAMYLKPGYRFKEPFEHDMSGLELTAKAPDYRRVFVNRVEPESAAEEVGLEPADEILSVNLKSVREMDMEEINTLFSSREKRTFILFVQNLQNERRYVLLRLKKRI